MSAKRLAAWLLALVLVFSALPAAAANPSWDLVPGLVCPGEEQVFLFTLPDGMSAEVSVWNGDGEMVMSLGTFTGSGSLEWDGTGLEAGAYTLLLDGGIISAKADLVVGAPVPGVRLLSASSKAAPVWTAAVHCSMGGELVGLLEDDTEVFRIAVTEGRNEVSFDASALPDGRCELSLRLESGGDRSSIETAVFEKRGPSYATDTVYHTPAAMTGVDCPHEICFWNMNMGEMDDEAIWAVLTQPITVLDGSERHQIKVRRDPDESCTVYTGEVTGTSQAVHVLERGEEWTLIQAYSSSVEGSKVAVFAKPFTGYVKTELLKERPVSQHTGIVIDKLQQRLYLYVDGHLYSTLLCSTGFSKSSTPFNETPAGEFVVQSWTGGFWSGSLWCDYGIRINDGILLHEVPVLITTDENGVESRNEDRCERFLGEKASHGCIRIQRKLTPEGVNMKWLWDHIDRRASAPTKVIIWDEVGRTLAYPDDGVTLYYNPKGGRYYHAQPTCEGVKTNYWPLTPFIYGQLSVKPYNKLSPCPYCSPQLTHEGIDTVNSKNTRQY